MESRDRARLIADVRFLGDAEGLTARHPDADIARRLNAAIRALRSAVTSRGAPYFLTSSSAASFAGTQVSGEGYSEVAWPSDAVSIHGVDVESSEGANDWRPLQPIAWVQRRNAWYGAPTYFAVRTLPIANETATTAGAIDIFPYADSGRYKVWYLPDFTDLDEADDVFLGLPDWHDWVVWQVVEDLAARDDDQRETFAIARQKKAEAWQRIEENVGRVVSAGALRPRRRSAWGRR